MSQIRVDEITDEVGTGSPSFPNGAPGFPLTSSDMPTGSVIQVISVTKTTQFSTTSTSFVDVPDLSISITPLNANNKILVFYSISCTNDNRTSGDSAFGGTQILRNTTSILERAGISRGSEGPSNGSVLDSPSTTSQTTYNLRLKADNGGSAIIQGNPLDSTMTLMEIAG